MQSLVFCHLDAVPVAAVTGALGDVQMAACDDLIWKALLLFTDALKADPSDVRYEASVWHALTLVQLLKLRFASKMAAGCKALVNPLVAYRDTPWMVTWAQSVRQCAELVRVLNT